MQEGTGTRLQKNGILHRIGAFRGIIEMLVKLIRSAPCFFLLFYRASLIALPSKTYK